MELSLFEEVGDLVLAMTPEELGSVRFRAHRRGIKVWFDTEKAPREHYEAQQLPRRHVDGRDGMAIEVGFHTEHPDEAKNDEVLERMTASEKRWRKVLGPEAEIGEFYGSTSWRRISEAWIEPDLDDPELSFELASRLVDYLTAIEPARR